MPCFKVSSGPRRTFQLSVTGGATYLTERKASLCHQKVAAAWHSLSDGAQGQDGKAATNWSCLVVQCRGGLPKLRQGFHRNILHGDKPNILQDPDAAGLPA